VVLLWVGACCKACFLVGLVVQDEVWTHVVAAGVSCEGLYGLCVWLICSAGAVLLFFNGADSISK
jgi:hypothetical protein